jgi:hypothetical protein
MAPSILANKSTKTFEESKLMVVTRQSEAVLFNWMVAAAQLVAPLSMRIASPACQRFIGFIDLPLPRAELCDYITFIVVHIQDKSGSFLVPFDMRTWWVVSQVASR